MDAREQHISELYRQLDLLGSKLRDSERECIRLREKINQRVKEGASHFIIGTYEDMLEYEMRECISISAKRNMIERMIDGLESF